MYRPARPHRLHRGFTLIEILVVITILAILVAFLVPALGRANATARTVQVRTDISALESAIAQFKNDFQIEPPSSILLYETGADWVTNAANPAIAADVARSRSILRQLWPQYNFTANIDINRDGDTSDSFSLAGAECLVFFLGGTIAVDDTNGNGQRDAGERAYHNGFSKNPVNPFAVGGNRQGPFFEFNNARLREVIPPYAPPPGNPGFFVYLDPLPSQTAPYIYLSSYGGKGFRLGDLGTGGGLSHWYLQGAAATSPAWNATKFQIISPGADGQYGSGGPFQPTAATALPAWNRTTPALTVTLANRAAEADNITNFHTGRLSDK